MYAYLKTCVSVSFDSQRLIDNLSGYGWVIDSIRGALILYPVDCKYSSIENLAIAFPSI